MVYIKFQGLPELLKKIRKMGSYKKRKTWLSEIGEYMVRSTKVRMVRNQVEPKTTQDTLKYRKNSLFGNTTLVASGDLMDSIKYRVIDLNVYCYSELKYAKIHQYGGKAGRKRKTTIPQRKYLFVDEKDKQEISKISKKYMKL